MQLLGNRHARKNDGTTVLGSERHHGRRLRWAIGPLAAALLVICLVPAAEAGTGGASPYTPPTTTATSSLGEELAFAPPRIGEASWYGPGLWGHKTACGETLQPNTIGVAHRRLPCGTIVKFQYHGHSLVTQVIDRGPYVKGRTWDLTAAASEALELEGVGNVRYSLALEYARPGIAG